MSEATPIIGLNIRKQATSRSPKLGILPRGALVEIGERSPDGKWGRIKTVVEGQIAPFTQGGEVDPEAATGWVFLGELEPEPGEPETLDSIIVPPKPRPIKAGDLVGHVGEYQQYDDAKPTARRGWRPLLHVEVFSGEDVPGFVAKGRKYASTLPKGSGTRLVIESGAKLVYATEPSLQLQVGETVSATSDSPATGRWAKVRRASVQVVERERLGAFTKASNSYASGAVWTGWYVGAGAEARTRSEAEAKKRGYSKREVLMPTGAPLWIDRGRLGEGGKPAQLAAVTPGWNAFPLQLAQARPPEVGFTLVLSRKELEAVPAIDQAVDPAGHRWWRLSVRSTNTDASHSVITNGWVCEEGHPKVSWQSPWAWPGFEFVEEAEIVPVDLLSRAYHRLGVAEAGDGVDYKGRADKVEASALVKKIYEHIDRDKNGTLDAQELRAAMRQPLLVRSLARVVAHYESEWGGEMAKWDELDPLMQGGIEEWTAEKKRIDSLRWWPQLAGKLEGFPASPNAYHIHPIALVANFIGGAVDLSLEEARVRAFLRMIRVGEGTEGAGGYERLFGGSSFIKDHGKTYADHPRIVIKAGKYRSSAAGAYQVMGYTWDDPGQIKLRERYGIKDFQPKSQDRYGVVLVKHKRGALELVKQGKTREAIEKCNREWASLPGSPYGQPTVNWARAIAEYEGYLAEEKQGKSDLAIGKGEIDDLLSP